MIRENLRTERALKSLKYNGYCADTVPMPDNPRPHGTRRALGAIARAARGGLVTVPEVATALGITPAAASAILARLARREWVSRVRRGLYAVRALEAGDKSAVSVEDPWLLGARLFAPCYIGGWSAAEHWELTEQIFRSTFIVSAASIRRSADVIAGSEFRIVRVSEDRLSGTEMVWRGRERVAVSGRERTIVDALRAPAWVGGVRHLARILSGYRESSTWKSKVLLDELSRHGRGVAWKRLGKLLETMYPDERDLIAHAHRARSAGVVKFDPSVRTRGRLDKRWGLWLNVAIEGPESAA